MKKLTLLAFFLCFGLSAMAQIEIGLQLSPAIAGNRFIADDQYNLEKSSNKLRMGVGVIADYFFARNYAFTTGAIYRGKGGEFQYNYSRPDGSNSTARMDYNLHYLELPFGLKLFTNEVSPDVNLFFNVGGSLNALVATKINDRKVFDGTKASKRVNTFEADAIIGGGAEMALGESTKLFAGLSYHHGLTNIDNFYRKDFGDRNIGIKNSYLSIDFGVKF